jgi:muconolactone delta-isomerase
LKDTKSEIRNPKSEMNPEGVMLFFLHFEIPQPDGMPLKEYYEILSREAEAALAGVKSGKVKAVYKVSGRPTILSILDADDHDQLDRMLAGLPVMRAMGASVDLEVLAIRPYEHFAEDVKKVLAKM